MKVAVFVPYAGASKEGGLVYLVANYLRSFLGDVINLRCNGAFSLCDRDEEIGWRRTLDSCHQCTAHQNSYASWSSVTSRDLTQFISSSEVISTRRWIHSVPTELLTKLNFRGINLYEICLESLSARLGNSKPDLANKKHEQLTRRMLLSAARMCLATKRFQQEVSPDITLVANGSDFLSRSFVQQSTAQKRESSVFKMDINERCVKITHPKGKAPFSCELLMTDITHMRADTKTWPREIIAVLEEILSFLQIEQIQITLPLAR